MVDLKICKMGYILAYRTDGSWVANRIRDMQLKAGFLSEHADFTHVEISGGEKHSIQIAPPRARLIDITKTHKDRYVKIMVYKNSVYNKSKRYKVAYFSATLNNLGYDFLGVLRFLVRWIKQNNRYYFCSEGVSQSLQKVFPKALEGRKPSDIMPADFLNQKEFECAFEGIIE